MPNKEQEYRDKILALAKSWFRAEMMNSELVDEIERLSASHFATPQMEVDLGKVFDENYDHVCVDNEIFMNRENFIRTVQPLLSASTQIRNAHDLQEISDDVIETWMTAKQIDHSLRLCLKMNIKSFIKDIINKP